MIFQQRKALTMPGACRRTSKRWTGVMNLTTIRFQKGAKGCWGLAAVLILALLQLTFAGADGESYNEARSWRSESASSHLPPRVQGRKRQAVPFLAGSWRHFPHFSALAARPNGNHRRGGDSLSSFSSVFPDTFLPATMFGCDPLSRQARLFGKTPAPRNVFGDGTACHDGRRSRAPPPVSVFLS